MNLLIIHRLVGYVDGGNETFLKELSERMVERGHKVDILTSDGRALRRYGSRIGVKAVPRIGPDPPISYPGNQFRFIFEYGLFLVLSFLGFVLLFLRRKRYDLVIVHSFFESYLAQVIRAFSGIPYVFVLEGPSLMREAKKANLQIAISSYLVEYCERVYGFKPLFIPKGIDRKRFNPSINGAEIRCQYLGKNEMLVLTVCRLDPRKDLKTLILAAKKIHENHNVRFIIVGDGAQRKILDKMIKDLDLAETVILVGNVSFSDDRLPKFYRAADLFILPTQHEGFGFVLAEAMSSGVPIVSNMVGAVPNVVGNCGVLIEPGMPDILVKAIIRALYDDDLRKKMIERGLQEALKYDWGRLASDYETAFEKIVKCKRLNQLQIAQLRTL